MSNSSLASAPRHVAITVYCVPACGHSRAVLELLRRRGLPFAQWTLTPETADEVIGAFHLYGSPILRIDGEVVYGTQHILARIHTLAATSEIPHP